jgi:hypothetical protein
MRIINSKLTVALSSYFAVAVALCLTACPMQSACPPCFIGNVMAPGSQPNPSPNATVNLKLSSEAARHGEVSEVHLTISDGSSRETVTYGAREVGTLDDSTMLTIPDNAVYSVDDQAPRTAEVEIVFVNGHRESAEIDIRTE